MATRKKPWHLTVALLLEFSYNSVVRRLQLRLFFAFTSLIVASLFVSAGCLLLLKNSFVERIYPNISIDNINVGGKTQNEVRSYFADPTHQRPLPETITIAVDDIEISSTSAQLSVRRDYERAIVAAFQVGHRDFFPDGFLRLLGLKNTREVFTSRLEIDENQVKNMITELKKKVDVLGQDPAATLGYSGSPASLKIFPGKIGREVVADQTLAQVLTSMQDTSFRVQAPVASTSSSLNSDQVQAATKRAQTLVGKKILLRADNFFVELSDTQLVNLLQFPEELSDKKLQNFVDSWKKEVTREPQNAELSYDEQTLQVKKFTPPRLGLALAEDQAKKQLAAAISELEKNTEKVKEIVLPVASTQPNQRLAGTNQLGITERIGFGESQYEHSIPNRISNVALTAKKVNNIIVKPGDEFSFNLALGEVSAATGFKSAYVIKNGRTELGDGGGVCQVSTTLFRAVLNAGLPVTKRKAHSYRVSYYELNAKPGIDATVYTGDVDLRFVNDTGKHLLIHTQTDSTKLYMTVEIFGTSDGRSAEIVDHKTWGFAPAPPPSYIDDPSLPRGRTRQIDFAASGIKASFKNIVKDRDGKVIREDEYFSNYQPWRAVYLRGTG